MVYIDGSYFGHQKLKKGEFHSGSKMIGWYDPPHQLLDFVRDTVTKGNFSSMCLDIFETTDGRYLVNELQSLFGQSTESQMYVNGIPGRYIYADIDKWSFVEGFYCENGCSNLRVNAVLKLLGKI